MKAKTIVCVVVYLAAAVAANTLVSVFGVWALLMTATLMVPINLTTRDVLHEQWIDNYLPVRMAALVIAGSCLSFFTASQEICYASMIAFACSSSTDTAVYHMLHNRTSFIKMNTSNIASSIVDSTVFPFIAFGVIVPSITISQATLKIVSGIIWTAVALRLYRYSKRVSVCL